MPQNWKTYKLGEISSMRFFNKTLSTVLMDAHPNFEKLVKSEQRKANSDRRKAISAPTSQYRTY